MASIKEFVRGLDRGNKVDHYRPTHALWINISGPGEINIVEFDDYAETITRLVEDAGHEGVQRDLKYLAFGTDTEDSPDLSMILFYPGFNHADYLARIRKNQKGPLRSAGLVSLFMPEKGLAVAERRIWKDSYSLQLSGRLDMTDSNAFKLVVMRRYLEPPFTFR